jgi:hypothetical protein
MQASWRPTVSKRQMLLAVLGLVWLLIACVWLYTYCTALFAFVLFFADLFIFKYNRKSKIIFFKK